MMKKIYAFGNGNLSWDKFHELYVTPLKNIDLADCEFIIGDFSRADTLMMEYLKDKTEKVTILHIGIKPRYKINTFKTKAAGWTFSGGFQSDAERDDYGVSQCTHFLGVDFNSDAKRKSGTLKNIEKCLNSGKIKIE
ncbi:hypothetical protein [Chryseobacterium vaccae]|uniref:hypothetical protein n=1 Tax=Chryseobacterium vaccae TaxID=2604424 RepID=UPI001E648AD7|nr:hypothetical protein [Chryseobacterium vaccae]